MKYLITVYDNPPGERYEEWARTDRELSRIVTRITRYMKGGETMTVTDLDTGRMQQERRKVAA